MNPYGLLTSQKNELLEMINRSSLEPSQFEWAEVRSRRSPSVGRDEPVLVPILKVKGTEYFFVFEVEDGKPVALYSPGRDRVVQYELTRSWDNQESSFGDWLYCLTRELQQPDLWEQLSRYRLAGDETLTVADVNTQFTFPEVQQIHGGIENIRAYLSGNVEDYRHKQADVDEKLDYLIGAAKRQGRKDWFHTAVGVLCGISASLSLDPQKGKAMWELLKAAVEGMVRLLP